MMFGLSHLFKPFCLTRHILMKTISRRYQVSVLGGSTDIGKTLTLMLRNLPSLNTLKIHDYPQHTAGVILDLSHIPASSTVIGYCGENTLGEAVQGSQLVIVTGNTLKKRESSTRSPMELNCKIIKQMAEQMRGISPMPFIGIVSEPINTLVPMAAELLQSGKDYNPQRLFGITIADTLRARALYASNFNVENVNECEVPVIGGHSVDTVIPLLSQAQPKAELSEEAIKEFTTKFRYGDESYTREQGWSPVLPLAYGALIFTKGILSALSGKLIYMNAFVENNDLGTSFFSGQVFVNEDGVKSMRRYTNLSQYELQLLESSLERLRQDVNEGKRTLEVV